MSKPKNVVMRNKSKRNKKSRRHRTHKRVLRSPYKKGGGCNCGASHGFFSGGNPSTNGLSSIGGDKLYPLNTFRQDPNYMMVDSRGTGNFVHSTAKVVGGKRVKSKRSGRKMKGGTTTGGLISGIQSILPSTLPGASEFTAGSNGLMEPVQFAGITAENPIPKA